MSSNERIEIHPGGGATAPLPFFGRKRGGRGDRPGQPDGPAASSAMPRLLTIPEVARCLRTTESAVYAMSRRRQLPGVIRIGRNLRVVEAELVQWLRHKSDAVTTERAA